MQNRGAFIIGVTALGLAALLRTGEHLLLKRLLFVPRVCVILITSSLLLSSLPLLVVFPDNFGDEY